MSRLKPTEKLLSKIDSAIKKQWPVHVFRKHLGASIIGHDCARYVWYTFHWVKKQAFDAQKLRVFERGLITEPRVSVWLKQAGVRVWMHDKKGHQFKVSTLDGHFGGSLDGIVKADDLGTSPHVLEIKTHGDRYFKKLVSEGVEKAFPQHYVQVTVYADLMKLKHGLYFALNANTEEIYLEKLKLKKSVSRQYVKRAKEIIFGDSVPSRIAKTKTFYKCKMCDYKDICWGTSSVEINCRTCAFIEIRKSEWKCMNKKCKNFKGPEFGCDSHIYHEDLFPYQTKILEVDTTNVILKLKLPGDKKNILYGPDQKITSYVLKDIVNELSK